MTDSLNVGTSPELSDSKPSRPLAVRRPVTGWLARGLTKRIASRARRFATRRSLAAAGLRGIESIPTYTTPEELAALLDLALACPAGGSALEIGSYLGASAAYLVAGLAQVGGTLACLDTWQNETMPDGNRDTFAEFERNVAPVRDRLIVIRKPTQDLTSAGLGGPFHLVFIDGDHSYAAVKRDFELIAPALADNAVVAFHDSRCFQGVSRVIGEVLVKGEWCLGGVVGNLTWLRRPQWASTS
jgi:predicted O-methyltransferase YrrM